MKTKFKITPLTTNEEDKLKGGFTVATKLFNSSGSMTNENCSGDGWWSNGNCGCSTCGTNTVRTDEQR